MKEKNRSERNPEGWNPDAPTGEEALAEEERSLDIGESGQFAPVVITINKESINQGIVPLMMTTLCRRVAADQQAD